MTLALSLRFPFSLPRVFRAHRGEPQQEYHWIGKTGEAQQETGSKEPDKKPTGEKNEQGYRSLAKIQLGEVESALAFFEHQLLPAHVTQENWIGKNLFCIVPLKRNRDGRPPVIFGLVKTCYPSDGHVENVEDVEILFPRKNSAPDLIYLHKDDISLYSQKHVQSFYLRVQFKASEEDAADFEGSDPLFHANGFHLEFDHGYYDLLEMNEQNQSDYPRLYVIGSRWLASLPESRYFEITSRFKEMLGWGKLIINYHADWLPKDVNTLNRALGFKYEFTPTLLTEPSTPQETAYITAKLFDGYFMSSSAR